MSDSLHHTLSSFRDKVLHAISYMEFELRDTMTSSTKSSGLYSNEVSNDTRILSMESSIDLLRKAIVEFNHTMVEMGLRIQDVEQKIDFLSLQPNMCSRNILCTSQPSSELKSYRYRRTSEELEEPLSLSSIEDIGQEIIDLDESIVGDVDETAPAGSEPIVEIDENVVVDAAEPPEPEIDETVAVPSSESVHSIDEDADVEDNDIEEAGDGEDGEDGNGMTAVDIDGVTHYIDGDNNVFVLEEGAEEYTHVATYDPEEGTYTFLEQEGEAEREEEQSMEEFIHKGKTYYRDADANVYTLDAEAGEYNHIGTWNGKKICKV